MSLTRRLASAYGVHRYAILFYSLLATFVAGPLLTTFGFSGDVLQVFLAFNVLVALRGVPGRRWRTLLLLGLAAAVAMRTAPSSLAGAGAAAGGVLLASAVAVVAVVAAMRFALGATTIGAEQIYAALSAYLLAGLFFGVVHWATAIIWPGSFGGIDPERGFSLSTAIYFSFVTLATLGYGDVVPRTEVARGIAVIEAVGGQLYIAVTIARLVGAQLSGQRRPG